MMDVKNSDDNIHIIEWRIINFSSCAFKLGEKLECPVSRAGNLFNTQWTVSLYPKGKDNSNFIGCYLRREDEKDGPQTINVEFEFSLITFDGLVMYKILSKNEFQRNVSCGHSKFVKLERIFSLKEFLLLSDTLTLRCKLRMLSPESKQTYVQTFETKFVVEKMCARLNLENFREIRKECPRMMKLRGTDNSLLLQVSMNKGEGRVQEGAVEDENPESSESLLHIVMTYMIITVPSHVTCWIKLLNNKREIAVEEKFCHLFSKAGVKEKWILPYFIDTKNLKSDCIEDDDILLDFEVSICDQQAISFQTGDLTPLKPKDWRETTLMKDLADLYTARKYSDAILRIGDETFPVHKSILSARSPRFEKIFQSSTNEMNSCEKPIEEITDIDKNTMELVLHFIYTDTFRFSDREDMNDEKCFLLYSAARKYQISSLQIRCINFLRKTLSIKMIYKVLLYAEECNDSELKLVALDYILEHYQLVLLSPEWQAFTEEYEELSNEVMTHLRLKKHYQGLNI